MKKFYGFMGILGLFVFILLITALFFKIEAPFRVVGATIICLLYYSVFWKKIIDRTGFFRHFLISSIPSLILYHGFEPLDTVSVICLVGVGAITFAAGYFFEWNSGKISKSDLIADFLGSFSGLFLYFANTLLI